MLIELAIIITTKKFVITVAEFSFIKSFKGYLCFNSSQLDSFMQATKILIIIATVEIDFCYHLERFLAFINLFNLSLTRK